MKYLFLIMATFSPVIFSLLPEIAKVIEISKQLQAM